MIRGGMFFILAVALASCEQNIGSTGPSDGRPSIVNACSEQPKGFNSEPQPRRDHGDRTPIVVNIPRPEPTIRCDRTDDRSDNRTGVTE